MAFNMGLHTRAAQAARKLAAANAATDGRGPASESWIAGKLAGLDSPIAATARRCAYDLIRAAEGL